ncbi:transglycosylase SLT domain-containing protein [Rhizobium sp. AAP43]|uniref:transglycosylase SLT domain-containing protein n=1 Tax=Rhizobium sp. AAP43 TaxID=1523420 RepID=UPI0006B964A1|nr:transglycosylase SLT domain-containing protein [Rhizobium sp. AAP43]KPF42042.1 lytic transglycosylase [Rhizobium sp. AAP43]
MIAALRSFRHRLPVLAVSLLVSFTSDLGAPALANVGSCERAITDAAARYGIPAGILYSVGLTETGRKGSLQPYAINVEGKAYYFDNLDAALEGFETARSSGAKLIDVGCMQINQHFHGEHFTSVEAMFDPQKNVEYAASFLNNLHRRHETWTMAVARYHAGPNNDPAQKRYVCRVIANLVATGYGKWTPPARQFCGE